MTEEIGAEMEMDMDNETVREAWDAAWDHLGRDELREEWDDECKGMDISAKSETFSAEVTIGGITDDVELEADSVTDCDRIRNAIEHETEFLENMFEQYEEARRNAYADEHWREFLPKSPAEPEAQPAPTQEERVSKALSEAGLSDELIKKVLTALEILGGE